MASTLDPQIGTVDKDLPAPTVSKAMAIIEAIGRHANGMTQAEIVQQTGCSANLVYRVLCTLVVLGYVERRDEYRRYVLTNRLIEVCHPRISEKSLVACAHSSLLWLRDRSRETVQLMIPVGRKGVVLEQVSGLEAVQVMGRVGMQVPLYSCSPGKAILAFLSESEQEDWFNNTKLKSFTRNTKTTREALLKDFRQIRRRGYAEDWEEGLEGIRCVAAPVLDAHQRPVGAITVMSPAKRLPQQRFVEVGQWCIEAAKRTREELLK